MLLPGAAVFWIYLVNDVLKTLSLSPNKPTYATLTENITLNLLAIYLQPMLRTNLHPIHDWELAYRAAYIRTIFVFRIRISEVENFVQILLDYISAMPSIRLYIPISPAKHKNGLIVILVAYLKQYINVEEFVLLYYLLV